MLSHLWKCGQTLGLKLSQKDVVNVLSLGTVESHQIIYKI